MIVSTCKNFDATQSKSWNNGKVAHGWAPIEVDWDLHSLVELFTNNATSGNTWSNGHKTNDSWVSTEHIMLDFDNGKPFGEVMLTMDSLQINYFAFTSINHQKVKLLPSGTKQEATDRFRVVIPLQYGIYNKKDIEIIKKWFMNYFDNNIDATCFDCSRYFYKGTDVLTKFVNSEDDFDYQFIIADHAEKKIEAIKANGDNPQKDFTHKISLDDLVETEAHNMLRIGNITEKTAIICPICGHSPDRGTPGAVNAFVDITKSGVPMIFCSSCKSRADGQNGSGIYYLNSDEAFIIQSEKQGATVFIDTITSVFLGASFERGLDEFQVRPLTSQIFLKQFCMRHNLPLPKVFPDARYELDFSNNNIIDFKNGIVNKYIAPEILKNNTIEKVRVDMPYTIGKLLRHVCGDSEEFEKCFINEMSDLIQTRKKRIVAFLFQGTQGTGKGIFFNDVLRQIIGTRFCMETSMDAFGKEFNGFLEDNVLLMLNEISGDFGGMNKGTIQEKVKIAITDMNPAIEGKGANRKTGRNHCSILGATNIRNALTIPKDDRRWNIAPRQEKKIVNEPWFINYYDFKNAISAELADFVKYLYAYDVDLRTIGLVIENDAKKAMQSLSRTNSEDFFEMLQAGDMRGIVDFITDESNLNPDTVDNFIKSKVDGEFPTRDLHKIYGAFMGGTKTNIQGFSKLCGAHGLGKARKRKDGVQQIFSIFIDTGEVPEW